MVKIAKKVKLEVFEPLSQKWKNHHTKPYHNSVNEAKKFAEGIRKRIKTFNKKAKKDLRPNAYGIISQSNMRIIDKKGKKTPATSHDSKQYQKWKKYYQL